MTVARGFVITTMSAIAFGIVGALLGYAVGVFAPDYYRVVFQLPESMELSPTQLGAGLGLTQGLGAGIVVGLVIVVVVGWYNARVEQSGEELR